MSRKKHHHPNQSIGSTEILLELAGLGLLVFNVWNNAQALKVSREHVLVNKQVLKQLQMLNDTEMRK